MGSTFHMYSHGSCTGQRYARMRSLVIWNSWSELCTIPYSFLGELQYSSLSKCPQSHGSRGNVSNFVLRIHSPAWQLKKESKMNQNKSIRKHQKQISLITRVIRTLSHIELTTECWLSHSECNISFEKKGRQGNLS